MKKTGEILRKAREDKGLSIHEIGLSLKINSKILKSIEEGDVTHLPAKTFLRGFVKSYASYLKINTEEVLRVFSEEMGSTKPAAIPEGSNSQKPKEVQNKNTEKAAEGSALQPIRALPTAEEAAPALGALNRSTNTKSILISFVLLMLIALITITKRIIDKYQKESVIESVEISAPPIDEKKPEAPLVEQGQPIPPPVQADDSKQVEKTKEQQNTEVVTAKPTLAITTAQPVSALSPATAKLNMSVSDPITPMPVKAQEKAKATEQKNNEQKTTPPATIVATPVVATIVPPAASPSLPANTKEDKKEKTEDKKEKKQIELIVEALDAVEIEFSTAKGKSEKIKLGAEQVHTIKSSSSIKLSVSNGGAVNIILNGRDKGVPGNLGKPITLSY